MLKKILSGGVCAGCRICCAFGKEELWEMPSVSEELKTTIREKYGLSVEYRELYGSWVFGADFDGDNLLRCPMLGKNGCVLGDDKPFECKVWPFRSMNRNGKTVVTISPLCGEINALPKAVLEDFAETELKTAFKTEIKKNPKLIKPYIEGYPIVLEI